MSTVEVTRDGPVAVIRMNRPEVHNALDPAGLDLLLTTVKATTADESVRSVVLTG